MKTGTKLGIASLVLALGTAVLWFYLVHQVSLPDDRTPFVVAFLAASALGFAAYIKGTSLLGGLPPVVGILIGLFLPLTIYISPQVLEEGGAIKVGDTIPHFTAVDGNGETFDSDSLHGHLALIKFFRAHW
ncbi:MAG: hypothetical protein QNI86_04100 [Halieaceae bacterium]|nr:hypothetical protein [Halieaceae bacterium]